MNPIEKALAQAEKIQAANRDLERMTAEHGTVDRAPTDPLTVQCDRCGADAGWPCVSRRRGTRGLVDCLHPHRERVTTARARASNRDVGEDV